MDVATSWRRPLAPLPLLLVLCCGDATPSAPHTSRDDPFREIAVVATDGAGYAPVTTISFADAPRVLAIRVAPIAASARVCPTLDTVTGNGVAWVPPGDSRADWGPYSTTGTSRTSLGDGYGLFLLPNDGTLPPGSGTLSFRVVLRDCDTRLPLDGAAPRTSLRVDAFLPHESSGAQSGHVRVRVAFASTAALSGMGDPVVARALSVAHDAFALAGIVVAFEDGGTFSTTKTRVEYAYNDHRALGAMAREAGFESVDRDAIPVVFAPCLVENDPLTSATSQPFGVAPHVPGGFSTSGSVDAVFIRTRECSPPERSAWPDGAILGKVLAHELGHYLGLYHSVEADGREDHLADTSGNDLMYYRPTEARAEGFTKLQSTVMRMHPLVQPVSSLP